MRDDPAETSRRFTALNGGSRLRVRGSLHQRTAPPRPFPVPFFPQSEPREERRAQGLWEGGDPRPVRGRGPGVRPRASQTPRSAPPGPAASGLVAPLPPVPATAPVPPIRPAHRAFGTGGSRPATWLRGAAAGATAGPSTRAPTPAAAADPQSPWLTWKGVGRRPGSGHLAPTAARSGHAGSAARLRAGALVRVCARARGWLRPQKGLQTYLLFSLHARIKRFGQLSAI